LAESLRHKETFGKAARRSAGTQRQGRQGGQRPGKEATAGRQRHARKGPGKEGRKAKEGDSG